MHPNFFTTSATKASYEVIKLYHTKGIELDISSLWSILIKKGLPKEDCSIIPSLLNYDTDPKLINEYVKDLFTQYVGRYLYPIMTSATKSSDPMKALTTVKDAITNIELALNNVSKDKSIGDVIDDTLNELWDDMKKETHIAASWGISDLDNVTGGIYPGIFVIGARPGMGKTAEVINIVDANAVKMGVPVVIFSLEMPARQLMRRIFSKLYTINSYALKTGQITDEDFYNIKNTIKNKIGTNLIIDDTPAITHQYIDSKLRAIRKKIPMNKPMVVIIDYLQLMSSTYEETRGKSDEAIMSHRCNRLNALWKVHNCAIIELSQLSRGVESRTPPRPRLSDLKDSGSLEANADVVIFQYRPDYYSDNPVNNKGEDMRGVVEFNVEKNRHGSKKAIYARFKGQYSEFNDFDEGGIKSSGEESF